MEVFKKIYFKERGQGGKDSNLHLSVSSPRANSG